METVNRLSMTFYTEANTKKTITITNPKDDLDGEEVQAAMETIVNNNIFEVAGSSLKSVEGAKLIQTTTTTLF